jgi:hypothetical protein
MVGAHNHLTMFDTETQRQGDGGNETHARARRRPDRRDPMQTEIRSTNIDLTPEIRSVGERRAFFTLGRFAPRIRAVSMWLSDINGPRGGIDTACRVRVVGREGWTVTVTDVDRDAARALTNSLGRAGRAVARRVDRSRDVGAKARRFRRAS